MHVARGNKLRNVQHDDPSTVSSCTACFARMLHRHGRKLASLFRRRRFYPQTHPSHPKSNAPSVSNTYSTIEFLNGPQLTNTFQGRLDFDRKTMANIHFPPERSHCNTEILSFVRMFKNFKTIVTLGTKKISIKSMTNPFLAKFNFSVSLAKYSYVPIGFTSDRSFSVTDEPLSLLHT